MRVAWREVDAPCATLEDNYMLFQVEQLIEVILNKMTVIPER